jgi:hypothetical protein
VSNNYADQRLIPARIRRFILPPDGPVCFYCGLRLATEIDHVIPVSQGGSSAPENLVAACYPCNHDKSDRTVSEWFRDIGLSVESALLRRFQRKRPFDEPPKRTDRFAELLDQVVRENAPDACWSWPSDMYRTHVCRRVYERLVGPLGKGDCLIRCQVSGWGCVNPSHQTHLTRAEFTEYQRGRRAARDDATKEQR